MKITCECLIDSTTGLPLVLDFPDHTEEDLTEIRTRAFESGERFRLGLLASEVRKIGSEKTAEERIELENSFMARSTNNPLDEFARMSAERAIENGFGLSREAFQEIWDQTLGPAITSGDATWECSDALAEHLEKVGRGELSDEEIEKLIDSGKI